jgi:hypothetical protein
MVFKVSFSPKETEQLFLTYLRNPRNYAEIKKRLFGEIAMIEFRKNLRGRLYFMATLTGIAVVSSFFSIFAEHWGSLGAIWIIWAGFMIGLGVALYMAYKDDFLVLKSNEAWFQGFETIAHRSKTLEDFIIDWNLRKDIAEKPKEEI